MFNVITSYFGATKLFRILVIAFLLIFLSAFVSASSANPKVFCSAEIDSETEISVTGDINKLTEGEQSLRQACP
jgi:hypothetical protein